MSRPRKWAGSRTTETAALTKTYPRNFSTLGTACFCGGPGGRPGMKPVCRACAQADRYMREVGLRRLVGLVGFAP